MAYRKLSKDTGYSIFSKNVFRLSMLGKVVLLLGKHYVYIVGEVIL